MCTSIQSNRYLTPLFDADKLEISNKSIWSNSNGSSWGETIGKNVFGRWTTLNCWCTSCFVIHSFICGNLKSYPWLLPFSEAYLQIDILTLDRSNIDRVRCPYSILLILFIFLHNYKICNLERSCLSGVLELHSFYQLLY